MPVSDVTIDAIADQDDHSVVEAARRARRPARLAAWLATFAGVLNLISVAMPTEAKRFTTLDDVVPGAFTSSARVIAAASGIALIAIAGGLHRRSRAAWAGTVALLIISAAAHVLKGLDLEEALVETFLAGLLVGKGEHFHAGLKFDQPRRLVRNVLVVMLVTFAFGVFAVQMLDTDNSIGTSIVETAKAATTTQTSLDLQERGTYSVPFAIAGVFYTGMFVVLVLMLAPHTPPKKSPAESNEALGSSDSLAWFATRDDRSTLRSHGATIAYRSTGAISLAAGDPLGSEQSWPQVIETFLASSARQGRISGVVGCGQKAADAYRRAGMRTLYLGDEAVVELESFSLEGKTMKTIRQSFTRATKAGYTATVVRSRDVDADTQTRLLELSDAWRGDESERGFSMALGRLFDNRDGAAVFIIGSDETGRPQGFLHLVPWGEDGMSLDVMRRNSSAINVLNDFLVVSAAQQLPAIGIARMSLNFSVLRGVLVAGAEVDASRRLRFQRRVLLGLSGKFQIESLYRFNKKFGPRWVPRFVMFETPEDAPRIMAAALHAEGFVSLPSMLRRAPKVVNETQSEE